MLDRKGGGDRKDAEGAQASGSPLAIVFGSVLDGIPESFVLGLTVLQGGVSVALLIGIVLSNLPEGLSSSSGLRIAGWPRARVVKMWLIVIAVSAVSAALGYVLLDPASGRTGAFAQGFAAGALLAMITDTMLPESYDVEQVSTGRWSRSASRSRSCRRRSENGAGRAARKSHGTGDAPRPPSVVAVSGLLVCESPPLWKKRLGHDHTGC